MTKIEIKPLLEAGVHFGHLTRKWNPNMAPFIHMEKNGIHIINLYKTASKIEEASSALSKIASSGRKILFVATKKQAKDLVSKAAEGVNMPYITERWPGGMLTNFVTIRKAVKKMSAIDRTKQDGTFDALSKREKLQIDRLRSIILNYVSTAIKSGLSERQKEKEVAEVIKEKEYSSESNDGVKEVNEPKEKKKRTRVTKKTEE